MTYLLLLTVLPADAAGRIKVVVHLKTKIDVVWHGPARSVQSGILWGLGQYGRLALWGIGWCDSASKHQAKEGIQPSACALLDQSLFHEV